MSGAKKKRRKDKGNCGEVAGSFMLDLNQDALMRRLGAIPGSLRLCHGEVACKEVPYHFHAWVEFDQIVPGNFPPGITPVLRIAYDQANGNAGTPPIPACVYRFLGRADNVAEYDREEALQKMMEHRHYGPWHPMVHPQP